MDLLETILRSSNAGKYIPVLKKCNIGASTLPLLSDKDLEILGVDDEDIRKEIISRSSKLQIPTEKAVDININRQYIELVLSQISQQLLLHHASLSSAVQRKDVVVCDLQLHKASQCLLHCINSLEMELSRFENKFGLRKKQKCKSKSLLIGLTAISATFAAFMLGKAIMSYTRK